ncbi:MAG: radical SAM protein, partial [Kiritimatiellaeota bacterium]|nr:radical SAM protein [Kiritimatiellota bacterium]
MHLTLHLTERCNMACRYCYQTPGADDMAPDTARAAIRACATGENCGVIFFGGEPLLRKDLIWDIIRECENEPRRFHYKVTTNGLLLDEDFLARAKQHRLHIALSHDGVAEAHDTCRVMPDGGRASSRAVGTFDALLPKLELLLRWQPYAPVMLTVNPETAT